jgi:outer membrane lipoprotein-sorting protein
MKTLRILTFSVSSLMALVCVCFMAPSSLSLAQEESAQKATDGQNPAPKTDEAKPATPQKVALRRNESSGAAALITMEQAREKLIGYESVRAEIAEVVTIGNRKLRLKGKYLQGTDLQLRFEYEVNVGGTKGSLLEVCDGQILWTYYKAGKQQRVSRRSVRQILEGAGGSAENLLTAEIGLGGLPGLLASIQRAITFDKQWEQDADNQTFIVVEGTWKPQIREKFLGANPKQSDRLPQHVPDRIRVYYDQTHLFPRRILYLKQNPQTNIHHPMVKLDFQKVEWDIELDEALFKYTPPENVPREDTTEHYVKQFAEAKKKAEQKQGSGKPGNR